MAGKEIQGTLKVNSLPVSLISKVGGEDYISLTDLAKSKSSQPRIVIANWMRLKDTIELLGLWEEGHNKDFNRIEFDTVKNNAGHNAFTMTPQKWIRLTNAIGIHTKHGKYNSGTYAQVDIALDFAMWISPAFRLKVLQEYRKLKMSESSRLSEQWQEKRLFASMNYKLHTGAIKDTMPPDLSKQQQALRYALEGDMLNMAVFGKTAKQWKRDHPNLPGNMRDYASTFQNLILSNLENYNSRLLEAHPDMSRPERLIALNKEARREMREFTRSGVKKRLEAKDRQNGQDKYPRIGK